MKKIKKCVDLVPGDEPFTRLGQEVFSILIEPLPLKSQKKLSLSCKAVHTLMRRVWLLRKWWRVTSIDWFNKPEPAWHRTVRKVFFCGAAPIDGKLPDGITHLALSDNWNGKLDKLPTGLNTLVLGAAFDTPLEKLPQSLRYLQIGSLCGETSGCCEHLSSIFSQSLTLPKKLQTLVLSCEYQFLLFNGYVNQEKHEAFLRTDAPDVTIAWLCP